MADENRIITFNYAKNNWDAFKKQTIPDTLECMTKTDINTFLNAEPALLNTYASNQLIPRNKFTGILSNYPTTFGTKSGFIDTSTGSEVPGWMEYNRLFNAIPSNGGNGTLNTLIFSSQEINDYNGMIINLSNTNGTNFIQDIINKAKELSNFNSLTGWTFEVKISGEQYLIDGGGLYNISKYLYNSGATSTIYYNQWVTDSNAITYGNLRHLTNVLTSGFTPNWQNLNNQISGHEKIDFCPSGVTINEQPYYQKPSDPHDTGFDIGGGISTRYNSDYFYFGKRQVRGHNAQYSSAPAGTPNFPRGCGVNGAMGVVYYNIPMYIIIECRTKKTSTGEYVNVGTIEVQIDAAF